MDKFKNVPIDADTKILFSTEAKFGYLDVLYQKWSWEGLDGESLIFVADEVAHMRDDELFATPMIEDKSKAVIKRNSNGFTFVNYS